MLLEYPIFFPLFSHNTAILLYSSYLPFSVAEMKLKSYANVC